MPTDPYVADRTDDEPRQAPDPLAGRSGAAGAGVAGRPAGRSRRRRAAPRRAARNARTRTSGTRCRSSRRMRGPFELVAAGAPSTTSTSLWPRLAMKRAASFGRAPIGRRRRVRGARARIPRRRDARLIAWRADAGATSAAHDYEARARRSATPSRSKRCVSRRARSRLAPMTSHAHLRDRRPDGVPPTDVDLSPLARARGAPQGAAPLRRRGDRPARGRRPTPTASTRGSRSRPTATPGSSGCRIPRSTAATAATWSPTRCSWRKWPGRADRRRCSCSSRGSRRADPAVRERGAQAAA